MDNKEAKSVGAQVFRSLESAVICANSLPDRDDLQLFHLTSPEFSRDTNQLSKRLASIIRSIASRYAVASKCSDNDSATDSTCSLSPRDALYDETIEITDESLEHFNGALDMVRGINKTIVPPTGALGPEVKIGLAASKKSTGGSLDIEKPQIHFPDYPIDNSDMPFIPPNSASLARKGPEGNSSLVDQYLQELFKKNSLHGSPGKHPYYDEIAASVQDRSKRKFDAGRVTVYHSFKETPCTMITTEEELFNMAEHLKRAKDIAVDIENHSHRSFQGFTCLIQISSRKEDFVIDALKLRASIHRALAPIFTDESIVKVLHGADKDIEWLERDFGMYIVNLFDTGQAARVLKLASKGLAYLLLRFCDIKATGKKKFQLADWRQRPLSKEMFDYARSDTHYLLYIYDRLRVELSKQELLANVWENSGMVSMRRYKKIRYTSGMGGQLAAKHGLGFDRHQIRLLDELWKWRDRTAREEDESLLYVSPLHCLYAIAKGRDKCRTVAGLMGCEFPISTAPPLIKKHAKELSRLVCDALDAKIEDKILKKTITRATNASKSEQEPGTKGHGSRPLQAKEDKTPALQKVGDINELDNKEELTGMGKRLKPVVLPHIKVLPKKRSAFFGSDSESDIEDERAHAVAVAFGKHPSMGHLVSR